MGSYSHYDDEVARRRHQDAVAKTKQNKRQREIEVWKRNQRQTRYASDVTERYHSLEDVFGKRVQFCKKASAEHNRVRQSIKVDDIEKYAPKVVSLELQDQAALSEANKMSNTHKQEKEDQRQTLNQQYQEAIIKVKDSRTFYVHGKLVKFSKTSLGMFDNKSKFRWYSVWLVCSKEFDRFILFMIMLNSAFLGIKDYTDTANASAINQFVESSEPFFTYVFLFECGAKIVAYGFILGSNSYLSEPWNWLDFIVVVTSLLQQIPDMKNMSGLRTFRLFRPLRSLNTMPSMRLLIGTLFSSVKQLGGILGLAMFFFMIFAILGVSLWDGKIHYRCYATDKPVNGTWALLEGDDELCSDDFRPCPAGYFCRSRYEVTGLPFADRDVDTDIASLNYGITNFDNVGYALLTIFQCITMEGWSAIMNIYEDAYASWFVRIYFILCVVICSFFLLNLTIAVMLMKYEELDKSQDNNKHNDELKRIGAQV